MRAGVFGLPSWPALAAGAMGLEALGYSVKWQRPGVWTEDQAEDFDVVMTAGFRLHSGRVADFYRGRCPVLAIDLPPIRRDGLWALWRERVNTLPDEAPDDRLGLVQFENWPPGDNVLVCGQKAGDAAHEMDREQIRKWAAGVIDVGKRHGPVVWRPHPQEPMTGLGADEVSDPETEPLSEALAKAKVLVTWNSTCGVAALMVGIPVECAPSAFYAELSGPAPDEAKRRAFFSRLTHVCWTGEELASGQPQAETLARAA